MVIDFHTHAFPDSLAERAIKSLVKQAGGVFQPCSDGTLSGLIQKMDEFGVDISVLMPVITKPSQTESLNLWARSAESDRIRSFGAVHPDTDDYKRDIDFVVSLGLRGLKFHCEYQGFILDEPRMLKIYDYAFEKGLIILRHAGFDPAFDPPYRSSPKQFLNVLKQMKGGTLVAAHFGGQSQWDDVERYLVGEDIYIDTSMGQKYYPPEQFVRIVKNHGKDRVLFASDAPWSRAGEELEMIEKSPLTEDEKTTILYKNAKRLLGI